MEVVQFERLQKRGGDEQWVVQIELSKESLLTMLGVKRKEVSLVEKSAPLLLPLFGRELTRKIPLCCDHPDHESKSVHDLVSQTKTEERSY